MDGESSYESDISESWSLIEINTNEESLSSAESSSELQKCLSAESDNIKSIKSDDLELKDFPQNLNELKKNDFGILYGSDSHSSFVSKEVEGNCCKDIQEAYFPSEKDVEDEKNDSDVESIEILEMDGNYEESEIDKLDPVNDSHDSQTCQSDDEESLEENVTSRSKSSSATVIKRKRKRCSKSSEGAVNIVNSEDKCPEKSDSKVFMSEKDSSKESVCEENNHPVYKHYRNNVANTILSLSMGVIFAGVACMAIGHFLGVQDAAENTGELVETLKKLQVENAALQSQLFHLNRALLNRGSNSKLGLPPNKVSCEEAPQVSKPGETDLNGAALSEIRSSLKSIEWLSKLQNLVRSEGKAPESGVDFKGFGMYIHDQLNFLRGRKEGGAKLLEDADRKISKVLQKIVTRLSTSQENIENLYRRLMNLKDKLNDKLNKIFPDVPEDFGGRRRRFEKRTPVTEHDLQSIQWKADKKDAKNYFREHPNPVVLYQFPQPEKYYQVGVDSIEERNVDVRNSTEKIEESEKKDKKSYKVESEKKKHKKHGKSNSKIEESKEKELKNESKEKRHKRGASKFEKKEIGKEKRRENKFFQSEPVKPYVGRDSNSTGSEEVRHFKVDDEVTKPKRKGKKAQKVKVKKVFLSKEKDSHGRRKYSRPCAGHQCFNSTGYWVFRWAGGREEFRRHQKLGEWQFERAKGRKELRDEDCRVNWQLKRALGRESSRHGGRWRGGKRTRFNTKEFFHEGFSWI